MDSKGCHFINGRWVRGSSVKFTSKNPATEKTIWEGTSAIKEMIDEAVSSAIAAFSVWRDLELDERISYLKKFREALLNAKSSLAEAISQSTGKPLWESITEVVSMANKIDFSIEAYRMRCPTTQKKQPQGSSITTHRAHGVMAVLGPFNFPGHLPNGHIIPALIAGNTVVFKPSELAPLVAEITLQCWEASRLPKGVVNMIQGGKETGQQLAEHPEIDGLLFTGSWKTGKSLSKLMAKTPYKILALEMGGNNPLVIGSIKDYQTAAYLTILSAFLTSGQRCSCARRLILQKDQKGDDFLKVLIEMMKSIQIGPYTDNPEPFMGPLISRQAAEHLFYSQEKLLEFGAKTLVSLKPMEIGPAFLTPGLIDITQVKNPSDEEYFGPLLQVIRVDDFNKGIQEANRTKYGLTAGLLSDSQEEYQIFSKFIKAGIVNWNTPLTGASSAAPFGGIGQSGNNRPSAFYAADYCSYPIASLIVEQLQMPSMTSPGIPLQNNLGSI